MPSGGAELARAAGGERARRPQEGGPDEGGVRATYGFTLGVVRDWEQGRYQPDQASRAYLLVIECEPEAVGRALGGAA